MASKKLNKSYVSEIDKFLKILDKKCVKTQSQCDEMNKAQRVAYLRDNATQTEFHGTRENWEGV